MLDLLDSWLTAAGGLLLFGGAYYVHQRVRLTRTACVAAAIAGFVTYGGLLGSWVTDFAQQFTILLVVGVFVGVCVIVADVKGKRKGADRPALFAFYLVPIFLAAAVASLPVVTDGLRNGVEKAGTEVSRAGR